MTNLAECHSVNDIFGRVIDEFDLGALRSAEVMTGGGPDVVRLVTTMGSYVLKPVRRPFEIELYSTVERTLNGRGVRQARLFRTRGGSAVSTSGHSVQELLPGSLAISPTPTQCDAVFRHLAAFDAALADIAVPAELDATDTVFTRVVRPDFLRRRLPELFGRYAPGEWDRGPVEAALTHLGAVDDRLQRLPRRLVHGDIGPDNVLCDGDEVVSVIDFTPFHAPTLFGLATALYWFHVHGIQQPDPATIRRSLREYGAAADEISSGLLLLEALRRLATPFALAEETGQIASVQAIRRRYGALTWLIDNIEKLRR